MSSTLKTDADAAHADNPINLPTNTSDSLVLSLATPDDASQIAEIHMSGFNSDPVLLAAFPTPSIRAALQENIASRIVEEMQSATRTVLVVRQRHDGKPISYSKWGQPIPGGEKRTDDSLSPRRWPEGTVVEVLERYGELLEDTQRKVLGPTPCFCLYFIATNPDHRRRGAASLMVEWGIQQSKKQQVPIYLESTVDACPFYEKLGFVRRAEISIELQAADGKPFVQTELALTFTPAREDA